MLSTNIHPAGQLEYSDPLTAGLKKLVTAATQRGRNQCQTVDIIGGVRILDIGARPQCVNKFLWEDVDLVAHCTDWISDAWV